MEIKRTVLPPFGGPREESGANGSLWSMGGGIIGSPTPPPAYSKFVAIASGGSVSAYSADGVAWTTSNMPYSGSWIDVAYGDGKFVAIDSALTNQNAYSNDGINWTLGNFPASYLWNSIVYGNGKFVAVGRNTLSGTPPVAAYSTDGISWTISTLAMDSLDQNLSIAYGNQKFVIVQPNNSLMSYSTDGISWTASNAMPQSAYWIDIAYGNGMFVALSSGSSSHAYSTDGVNWQTLSTSIYGNWRSITYADGKFVALDDFRTGMYSTNGLNWSESQLPPFTHDSNDYNGTKWDALSYGNGKFVAIPYDSNFSNTPENTSAYSTDGINWIPSGMPESALWRALAYG